MDCLVGCASSIAANFVDSTIGVVARRLFPYRRDVDNLTAGIPDLCNARQTVEEKVRMARDEGLVIHADVEEWRSSAGVIYERAQAFRDSSRDRANISCCTLRIPNLASRRGLSREARQLLEELERKIEAGRFDSVASRPAMHRGTEIRGDYEHFESRKAILEGIMTALRDRDVTKVGVHGMGGIGKTKLAQEVARRATEANLFTEVVETTVSQKPDIRRLQQDIAGKMKLEFKESEGERERADKLLRLLKEEKKKILIILDDIWERLDLLKVGIHFEHEGCKILMTSRYQVALNSMRADWTFKVEDISAEEAMRLFKTIVGGDIIEQPGIATLVNDVVRECGCLPLAITTVAYALRCQKDPSVWSNALMQLRISAPTDIDGMLVDVYQSIKLSYDFLNSTEAKSLFLLCSLHGEDEDISVEDLMMISVGQGLFQNVHKLSDARNRVKSLVGKLKDHCLLLDGNDSGTVKMHDVIRDVALYIASESGQDMHCIYTDKVEECLNNRKLKNAKVVSLVQYEFEANQLPEGLDCSHLESLFHVSYVFKGHLAIPKHFLEGKDQLKSLFFSRANLVALSPPIHSLQNLQTLCLRGCVLEDVSFIGDLKSLIILDLSYSTIKQLPIEVRQLNRLQLLNLEGCEHLELIEPNVISSLIRLEELSIPDTFDKWEVGEITVSRRSNANLAELMNLPQLTSLCLRVPHYFVFPKHFKFSEKLGQYRICIGGSMSFDRGITRSLQLKLEERSQLKELGLESLVKRSEALSLDGLAGVKNVVCDLDNEGFSYLKHLRFSHNVSVQYIVNCTVDQQIHLRKAFPMLETLRLEELTNLERICQGKLPQDSFNELREVDVTNCDKLKNLFPLSIAKRLKKIKVGDCDMMEEVVGHGRENDAHVISDEATHHVVEFLELRSLTLESLPKFVQFINWSESEATCGSSSVQSPIPLFCEKACNSILFPKLEDLMLFNLPALRNFCVGDCIKFESLSELTIQRCPQLETFFSCSTPILEVSVDNEEEGRSGKILFPKLRDLRLENLPAFRNFCVGDCIKFESLSMLTIEHCPQLETFFSCSTPILEVSVDNEEEGRSGKILFPKLRYLWLYNLPALRNFCVGDCIKFESLSELTIEECPQLKTFLTCSTPILEVSVDNEEGNHSAITQPFFNEKLQFPSLEDLTLSGINVQILWLDFQLRTTSSSLDNLTLLDVSECKNLKYLFPFFIAERLVKLETLIVSDCEVMEDIVVMKNLEEEGRLGKILFPKLTHLTLFNLPALRNFCVGDCIKFESLSQLTIQRCPQLETFFSCSTPILEVSVDNEEEGRSGKILFPKLRDLRLENLPAFRNFCVGDCIKFESLSMLTIEHCPQLETFFSCSTPILEVSVDNEEEGRSGKILFPKLRDLRLENLPAFRNFCVGDCIKFESLSMLTIEHCPQLETFFTCSTPILEVSVDNEEGNHSAITQPLFIEKLVFPSLEELILSGINVQILWLDFQLRTTSYMDNLTRLNVSTCNNLKYQFPFFIAERLVKLEKLSVKNCEVMEDIVVMKNLEEEGRLGKILFPNLTHLTLENLPALRNVCVGDCIKFESLSGLVIQGCPQLKTFYTCSTPILEVSVDNEEGNHSAITQPFFNEKLVFPSLEELILSGINVQILWLDFQLRTTSYMDNLTRLNVSTCNNLKYQFPFFIAERLVKLEKLSVKNCEVMEDIVVMKNLEEEGRLGKILFPNLTHLTLENLPALRNVCVGDCIKFESLSGLVIQGCPQLKTFYTCSTPILEVSVDNEEGNHSAITQPFFNEKLVFPSLEELILSGINVQILWLDFQLRTTSYMDNLTRLNVSTCNNLKYLFPFFIAERLVKLEKLIVSDCELMEDIVVMKNLEEEGRLGKILFPNLTHLWLYNLPALRNVCVEDCIKFESLSMLTIEHCPQLETFFSCSTPILEVSVDNEEGNHSAITQPFFNEKLGFPSLEHSILSGINVQIFWLDFQPRTISYMDNLTGLDVSACNNLKYLFPFFIAERLVKLEELYVSDCEVMEDIVVIKNLEEEGRLGKILFPNLYNLTLYNLPALRNFCVGDCIKFESLSQLTIQGCPQLKTFLTCSTPILEVSVDNEEGNHSAITQPFFNEKLEFPNLDDLTLSEISVQILWLDFQPRTISYMDNLTGLDVSACNNLKYLFPFFIAERLVNMWKLIVSDCEVMEDIVVIKNLEEEGRLGKILFPSLIHLTLDKLPALRNFCVGDCIKFESLSQLTIQGCPQLKTFLTCSTPILEVSVDNEEGNHSAITQPFFNEKLEFPILEDLTLSEISVQILWLDSQLRTTSYMDNLTSLDVSACNNLKYLFPFFIAERLVKLEKLSVKNCEVMEDIVVMKNLEEEGRLGKILFPNLTHLTLENLPALRNVCVGDCIKFESLSGLVIQGCPQLKTFYTCSTPILEVSVDNEEGNHSAITQPFFNEKVLFPVLEYLETDWSKAMNEQLNMSQSSSTALVLLLSNQLKELKLNCREDINMSQSSSKLNSRDKPIALPIFDLLRRYQNLEKLTLKGFFVISAQEYDGQLVANLTMLKLDNVPKLRYLFGESENAQPANLFPCFQNLTILEVSFCHRLTYLLASTIATSLAQLKEMRITDCNRMTTIIEDYRENETTKREHDHEFVFPKLKILELRNLPHLESFYSGNTDIRLPKLESLVVRRCPEMRTFSSGNISTPMLHEITDEWRSQSLDGDVNTTVRKLWEDDSNLTLQQLFTETEVHDSREGTSSRAAAYRLLLRPYFYWS